LNVSRLSGTVRLRQADFLQRAGEAEGVQQSERKGHKPGVALREQLFARLHLDQFARDEGDAESDRRFDRLLRQAEIGPVSPPAGLSMLTV
jgi:hypothetical protein